MAVIFEFNSLQGVPSVNIDGEIEVSLLIGNKGNRIGRDQIESQNHWDANILHPDNPKFQKSTYNWIFFSGGVEIFCKWTPEDNITQQDIDFALSLEADHPEKKAAIISYGDDFFAAESIYEKAYLPEWVPKAVEYEFAVDYYHIKALLDNTVGACIMTSKPHWSFETVDINPGEEKVTKKKGDKCYLLVGADCEVTAEGVTHEFDQWDCKKLTKESYVIKNTTDARFRAALIYRDE